MSETVVHPATADRWPDVATIFEGDGALAAGASTGASRAASTAAVAGVLASPTSDGRSLTARPPPA